MVALVVDLCGVSDNVDRSSSLHDGLGCSPDLHAPCCWFMTWQCSLRMLWIMATPVDALACSACRRDCCVNCHRCRPTSLAPLGPSPGAYLRAPTASPS